MTEKAEQIKSWIDKRRADNELTTCMFYISASGVKAAEKIKEMLKRNGVNSKSIDTVPGAWNLDRIWEETDTMDCAVEYCGVYPADWGMDDIIEFERMEARGEIIVFVNYIQDGKYIPNH